MPCYSLFTCFPLLLVLFIVYWTLCCISSKPIDSTNRLKIFWCSLIRFCLAVGHAPICRIMVSRCSLVFSQWNRIWSIVWYSLQLHVASSLRWNLCKYAFVIPCSVNTAVIFGVSFSLSLSVITVIVGGYYILLQNLLLWTRLPFPVLHHPIYRPPRNAL